MSRPWFERDYQKILDAAAKGRNLERIAAELDRSPTAVRAAVMRLVTKEGSRRSRSTALTQLKAARREPGYDWRARLAANGGFTAAQDGAIESAYRFGGTLAAAALAAGTTEEQAAKRLVALGAAPSRYAVGRRLAPTAGTALHAHMTQAAQDPDLIWIVIAPGQITLHLTQEEAETAADTFPSATIAARTVNGGNTGPTSTTA